MTHREQDGGGSSPLTRGKPPRRDTSADRLGLIPAHAGKTPARRRSRPSPRAHPRSRGENYTHATTRDNVRGSSPLTRGKRRQAQGYRPSCGLIPAHAGKTSRRACRSRRTWAHPRSRGENAWKAVLQGIADGSSPLTRGKPRDAVQAFRVFRLIPAHAGKTSHPAW